MRWSREQQLWLGLLSIVPGVLAWFKLVRPVYSALMLVVLYLLSKRHAFLVQRQFEREKQQKLEEEAAEKLRLAALPTKKRRSIEKSKLRKEAGEQSDEDKNAGGIERKKDE